MQCPGCQHENESAARFCEGCGMQLARRCPSCGKDLGPQARFCSGCGATLAEPSAARPATPPQTAPDVAAPPGERRQLTVLFCDLVGSTPLAQQLDPEEWRFMVAQYHKAAAGAVERFGGHVAQYLGDGLLVYFGWPDAREDDPERAVRAGLAILDAMGPVNARLATPDGTRLAVRVGMHTGPVVVAESGEVFGETPNLAARVQGAADPDTVVISAATQRLVAGIFVMEDRGPQALKGVRDPMVLYRVVQPSGVRSRLDVAAGRLTPFVGRDLEVGTLVDRWERAAEGEGQNVLVVGEAGVGKSRLVYQLRERLAAVPHTWLECRASPYTEGTPFHPVIDLVQQGLAFAPEDTAAEKIEKVERAVTLARLDLADAVPLIADFLGLAPPEGYPRLALNPDVQRRKTMELLAAWNLAIAETQPLVMLVEDLHWVDPSSLELFGRLMAQTATARVLLIATSRPEFTPPWPARSNLTTLQLARLTKRQAREMVAVLAGGSLSADMVDTLVARADGVPLYVEELTKGVAEPDVARGVDAIPATLADALMARLDRLSAAKEVAQRAAVLGREFPYTLLAAVAEMDEAALRQGIARLVEAEILFVRGEPPSAMYTFKHALVQEAAYGSLLKRTRQQLHGRVVDMLVERFPERVESEPELIARHAEAAGRSDDAITYYSRAGERAQARLAYEESIGHLRHALALVETLPETRERHRLELGLQIRLGASLAAARGWSHPENEQAYARARDLASQIGESPELPVVLCGLSSAYFVKGHLATAADLAHDALAAAQRTGGVFALAMAHMRVGQALLFAGRFSMALQHLEHCIEGFGPDAHAPSVSVGADDHVAAYSEAAWCHLFLGHPDRALTMSQAAVALANRPQHPFSLAFALYYDAFVRSERGELDRVRERDIEIVDLCERFGFPFWAGLLRGLRGFALVRSGEADAGIAEMQKAAAELAAIGGGIGAPLGVGWFAEGLRKVGRYDDALGALTLAISRAAKHGQHYVDAELHRLRAEVLLDKDGNAVEEAEGLFGQSLEIARRQEARLFELRAATSLARLLRDQGKRAEARAVLAPIYEWFTEGFDTGDLIAAKALLDELR
jgi:class 3 adenylate cyclase/tetratricopeptide (TPR) repeat protein